MDRGPSRVVISMIVQPQHHGFLFLSAVNSNGVRREVIGQVEQFRERYDENDDPTNNNGRRHEQRSWFVIFIMPVSPRDAQYIVECLHVLLQQERIAELAGLCLSANWQHHPLQEDISDSTIDISLLTFSVKQHDRAICSHSIYGDCHRSMFTG
jgi:hypothetical protein